MYFDINWGYLVSIILTGDGAGVGQDGREEIDEVLIPQAQSNDVRFNLQKAFVALSVVLVVTLPVAITIITCWIFYFGIFIWYLFGRNARFTQLFSPYSRTFIDLFAALLAALALNFIGIIGGVFEKLLNVRLELQFLHNPSSVIIKVSV